nr:hypothetical protein NG677_17455 [Methylobacterium sp. OTU13CASTA1]
MSKKTYRVGEGANLEALPHGTKVGEEIRLSPAVAMYEVDMGRLVDVEAEKAGAEETKALAAAATALSNSAEALIDMANALEVIPGETRGHPVDAVSGQPMILTDEERARLPVIGPASGPAVHGSQAVEGDVIEKTAVEGDTLTVSEDEAVASKSRRR